MPNQEKKRTQNFTESEGQILIKLWNKYKKVIQCKKTDAITNKQKEYTWQKITRQFHAVCSDASRTVRQLQEKYKAIKRKIRNDYSKSLKYVKGTGGGPYVPPPTPKTEQERELLETIKLSVEGLSNKFDGDGLSGTHGIRIENVMKEAIEQEQDSNQDEIVTDWTSASAQLWQTPKHPSLNITKNIPAKITYFLDDMKDGTTTTQEILLDEEQQTSQCLLEEDQLEKTVEESSQVFISNQPDKGTKLKKDDEMDNEKNNKKQNWRARRRPVLKKRKLYLQLVENSSWQRKEK